MASILSPWIGFDLSMKGDEKMFELMDLSIGLFAVVKSGDNKKDEFPIKVYGFIHVIENNHNYIAIPIREKISSELLKSGELDALKKMAIDLVEEAVADEFGD